MQVSSLKSFHLRGLIKSFFETTNFLSRNIDAVHTDFFLGHQNCYSQQLLRVI
jgi:hypothetical protein